MAPNSNPPKGGPWTSSDTDELVRLHGEKLTQGKVARAMGRTPQMIGRRSKELGLTWDYPAPTGAIAAHQIDARKQRAELRANLLQDATRLQRQLFESTTVYNFGGKDNTYAEQAVDQPPVQDQLKLTQAIKTITETIDRLDQMDADQGTHEAAGLLGSIAEAIQGKADELERASSRDQDLEELI